MKLLHTADWHIGRTLNGFSLLQEQKYAFQQIIEIAKREQVDGIIIAGDLYDRSVPSIEAVTAFNEVLTQLIIDERLPVYAISGNHDSARRLDFGHAFFKKSNFHLNTTIAEALCPIETEEAQLFLLPFIDPIDARVYYHTLENEESKKEHRDISSALKHIIEDMKKQFNPKKKQVLVTHFAVTKKDDPAGTKLREMMDSETNSTVGGLSSITSDLFNDFDYVALGHIHTRFASPSESVIYSGSPIAFNTKEAKLKQAKGVYIVDITSEEITKKFIPLKVGKEIVVLRETFDMLMERDFYQNQPRKKAWFSFQLVNYDRKKMEGTNIRAKLEKIYGTDIVELTFEENLISETAHQQTQDTSSGQSPEEIVSTFYQTVTHKSLSTYQADVIADILQTIRKEQ